MKRGYKTGKLTKEQLEWFRQNMYSKPLVELAKELPVTAATLCRIRSGEIWGRLPR